MEAEDELLTSLPIYLSSHLAPNLHLHQYPLLSRPLQVPPSAVATGKRIKARCKPVSERLEVHLPVDTRPEVWNTEKGLEHGGARAEEDQEELAISGQGEGKKDRRSKTRKVKGKIQDEDDDIEEEKTQARLGEVRLKSEAVQNQGDYYIGVVRNGHLHLHPISRTHQFRPTHTYLDILSRKSKPSTLDDDEEEEEPEKKAKPVGKEVQVSVRGGDATGSAAHAGLSAVKREMITSIRQEQEEPWQDLEWHDEGTLFSEGSFEHLFAQRDRPLPCTSGLSDTLTKIKGLR